MPWHNGRFVSTKKKREYDRHPNVTNRSGPPEPKRRDCTPNPRPFEMPCLKCGAASFCEHRRKPVDNRTSNA